MIDGRVLVWLQENQKKDGNDLWRAEPYKRWVE